jgi:hypothetical protein
MTNTAFTSTTSAHSFGLLWRVESKSGPKAKWAVVSIHRSKDAAVMAARALDPDGCEPDGRTLRIRAAV